MNSSIIIYFTVLLSSFILSVFIRKFFLKYNIVDTINHRSSHDVIATRTGGSVLFIVLFLYISFLYFNSYQPFDFSIIIPVSILFVTGLYDDIYGVDYLLKFIFQIIAAKLLIDMGYVIDIFSIYGYEFLFSRSLAQIITIIFYVALFNAYNFIDGIDSNLISESLKSIFLILFLFDHSNSITELAIIFSIALITILPFNLNKRFKVFMGDSGSLMIPVLIIFFLHQGIEVNYDQNIIKYIVIIFIYPLVDLSRVVLLRVINNKSPFKADKNHIHHHVNRYFDSHLTSSFFIFIFSGLAQALLIYILI